MNDAVDHLQLRLTISNIGAATYDLTKYLAQQGKPFSDSQYTIKNGKLFTKKLKYMKIPPEYRIVSFDIISLFANAPLDDLDETIEIISKRIYDNEEINTDILNKEMRKYCIAALKMHTSPLTIKYTFNLMVQQWYPQAQFQQTSLW